MLPNNVLPIPSPFAFGLLRSCGLLALLITVVSGTAQFTEAQFTEARCAANQSAVAHASNPRGQNPAADQQTPNVLILLVDDLGARDLGYLGSTFYETPHLDQLATRSLRFTTAYAAASVCSPSRAALLTGKHPVRLDITDWIPGNPGKGKSLRSPEDRSSLALEEVTLGEIFQQMGYQTFFAGKWHLGGPSHSPLRQGFGTYYDPHQNPARGQPGNQQIGEDRPHATVTMTNRLIQFLKTERAAPFLAVLSYYDVHTPIVPDDRFLEEYQKKAGQMPPQEKRFTIEHEGVTRSRQDSPTYASMVSAVDTSVGRLIDVLEEEGLRDNTIVIFTSDNGGLSTLRNPGPTCNLPLRSGKGWLYEGGIRIPLLIDHPEYLARTIQTPVILTDLFPTLVNWIHPNQKLPDNLDGRPWPAELRDDQFSQRPLYWHYPHYHGSTWTPGAAVRDGNWKLVQFYDYGVAELYDLKNDPGETRDVSDEFPDKRRELQERLESWQQSMGAKLPTSR